MFLFELPQETVAVFADHSEGVNDAKFPSILEVTRNLHMFSVGKMLICQLRVRHERGFLIKKSYL